MTTDIENKVQSRKSYIYWDGKNNDLSLVSKYIPISSNVLDIGCGKGHISVLLVNETSKIIRGK